MSAAFCELSIAEMGAGLRRKAFTAEELTRAMLDRVTASESTVHAFIAPTRDRALADARRADAELRAGKDRGRLHGIAFGLKDIIDVKGMRTTCGSRSRLDHMAAEDSAVHQRLVQAGGVFMGKLNTYEFAFNGPDETLPFPPARNPWDANRISGGSSSGSGVSVAAGMLRMAIGTDTGGSIRAPASWCGAVGIKPTFGRVSRRGVFPFSFSLDTIGPLARTVEDAAIGLHAIAGGDPADPSCADRPVDDYLGGLEKGIKGLRIGVVRNHFEEPAASDQMLKEIERVIGLLKDQGATVDTVSLPSHEIYRTCLSAIASPEAFVAHSRIVRERLADYGRQGRSTALGGATWTAADYVESQLLRRELTDATEAVLARYDVLLEASTLAPALPFDTPPGQTIALVRTMAFNVTGHPALSMPTGLSAETLPLSVQLIGRFFDETTVFRVGRAIEKTSGWDSRRVPTAVKATLKEESPDT